MATKTDQRAAAPKDYWKRSTIPMSVGRDEWRVRVIRGNVPDIVTLDNEVTEVSWSDDTENPMSGSITLARQFKQDGIPTISNGHLFILEHRTSSFAEFREIWRMRAKAPEVGVDAKTVTFSLVEDTDLISRSRTTFRYGKSKGLPDGPRLESVIRDAAEDFGFQIGEMYPMHHRVKKLTVKGSPLDLIIRCIRLERSDGSGRRLVWRWRNGKLEVVPLRRSRNMLLIGASILSASYTQSMKDSFATAIRVRGTMKSHGGKKRKKTSVLVEDDDAIERYGYILRELSAPKGVDTRDEAIRYAKRQLLTRRKLTKEVSFSHPGVASLRVWDAIKLYLPEVGLNTLCYVNSVEHSVSSGSYTMDVTIRFTDPFIDTRSKAVKLKRCKTLQKRKRKLSEECVKLIKEDKAKSKKKKQRT